MSLKDDPHVLEELRLIRKSIIINAQFSRGVVTDTLWMETDPPGQYTVVDALTGLIGDDDTYDPLEDEVR